MNLENRGSRRSPTRRSLPTTRSSPSPPVLPRTRLPGTSWRPHGKVYGGSPGKTWCIEHNRSSTFVSPRRLPRREQVLSSSARALTQLGHNVGARRDSLEAARIKLEVDDEGLLVRGVLGIRGTGGAPATNPRDFDLVCATLDRVASDSRDRARLLGLAASHASASPQHCGRAEDLATEAVGAARAAGDPDVLRQVLEDAAITVIDRPGAQRLLDIADELDGIPTPEELRSPTAGESAQVDSPGQTRSPRGVPGGSRTIHRDDSGADGCTPRHRRRSGIGARPSGRGQGPPCSSARCRRTRLIVDGGMA